MDAQRSTRLYWTLGLLDCWTVGLKNVLGFDNVKYSTLLQGCSTGGDTFLSTAVLFKGV